jgi:hypothetical protein
MMVMICLLSPLIGAGTHLGDLLGISEWPGLSQAIA